jgi:hypothetical protein
MIRSTDPMRISTSVRIVCLENGEAASRDRLS